MVKASKAAPPATAPVPYVNWTGLYAGGFIGYLHTATDNTFIIPPVATFDQRSDSGFGGGTIGAQYQWNSVVAGIEGAFGTPFSRSLGSAPCNPLPACVANTTISQTIRNGIWTFGGRAGWAFDRLLAFVSGGGAWASEGQTTCSVAGCPFEVSRQNRQGGYFGGGFDWAWLNGIIVGVEYRHYWMGSQTIVPTSAGTGAPIPTDTFTTSQTMDSVVFRLTYLLNPWSPVHAPLVAKD